MVLKERLSNISVESKLFIFQFCVATLRNNILGWVKFNDLAKLVSRISGNNHAEENTFEIKRVLFTWI
jgi:hypothetical protein